jgi:hypothetical protein
MVSPAEERTVSVHTEHEFLLKLEKAGLNQALAQKVTDSKDNELATKVVRLIANGGFEPSTGQKRAREIMGENVFGVEEAIGYFGVNPSRQQLAALAEVPFSEEVLVACKSTHILVAVFPMSILDIRGKVASTELPSGQKKFFYDQDWYNKEAFAKSKGDLGWQLVRKTPVGGSTGKDWNEQQALLGKDEETPNAQIVVYTVIGHFLAVGKRLFQGIYVRCSSFDSVDSDGCRGYVGYFGADGLGVNDCWDNDRNDRIGVASARKLQ